ncbi:hypothetical protein DACRYDRAFT_106337 [Dacryopinax primogenitus]|uniref:Amino acid permease/ SLC12A domain-containing protein n=1 Tax=Dacryopinax primogenitus (strain DJM 731) TaxID=1858805 RepID=M5FYQ5_DACPD|nr:uncharacterized protein DACRYDRAFT_106337 [Dacryopinax primogenitus]EJU03166.1 hypothetical protein DACRYDRAFT_106337 [Dacryopinax primogenitus]
MATPLTEKPSNGESKDVETGKHYNEKTFAALTSNIVVQDGEGEDFQETKVLKQGLKQRHIQMIALAGTIGTGLFLGSGGAITSGGPAGAFMGYLFVGILVSGVVISIAELSAFVPLSGGIIRHSNYFFDPALSFAIGWNTVYSTLISLPAEITAAAVIIDFWTTNVSNAVWITILGALLFITNLLFVRVYGELEFTFATLKIMLILGLIIMGLVVDLGGGPDHTRIGLYYWQNPGPFVQYLNIPGSLGQFLGFWATFSNAAYAYSGIEGISVAAAETRNPRQAIPKAAKRIFFRVLLFYVISILIVSMIVPSNDPDLLNAQGPGAAASPFVIAANRAGIKVLPSIINAVVLTSAWSSGNSGMLTGSRALYGLALEGHAPRIFKMVNRFSVPWVAVVSIGVFLCLAYMSVSSGAATVFGWFQDLVGSAALVLWIVITMVYLRFYYGCKAQGIDRHTELPWAGPFQPYAAWISCIMFSIILLTGGFAVFIKGNWDPQGFVGAYFNIPLIFILYFAYKFARRTKIVPLDEMPIREFIQIYKDNPEERDPPLRGWARLGFLWT